MNKKVFFWFTLVPYLVAYIAARDAHWVVHTTSYSYHCHHNGVWEPQIVSHGVRGGDYAVISPLFFMPVSQLGAAAWYIFEPVGSSFIGFVGPPPVISSSHCTQKLREKKRQPN